MREVEDVEGKDGPVVASLMYLQQLFVADGHVVSTTLSFPPEMELFAGSIRNFSSATASPIGANRYRNVHGSIRHTLAAMGSTSYRILATTEFLSASQRFIGGGITALICLWSVSY